jgi:hypothetical protein
MIITNKTNDRVDIVCYQHTNDTKALQSITIKSGKSKDLKLYKPYLKIFGINSKLIEERYFYNNFVIFEDKIEEEPSSYCIIS